MLAVSLEQEQQSVPRVLAKGTHPQPLPGFFQPFYPFFCHPFRTPSSSPLPGCPSSRFSLPADSPTPSEPQDWMCPQGINPGEVGEHIRHRLGEERKKSRPRGSFVPRIHCSSWWQQSPENPGRAASSECSRDLSLGSENPESPAVSPRRHHEPPSTHHGAFLLKTIMGL